MTRWPLFCQANFEQMQNDEYSFIAPRRVEAVRDDPHHDCIDF